MQTDTPGPRRLLIDPVEDARSRLAAMVESSDSAIVSTDPEWVVESWNPAAERLFGYTASEMVGRSILDLVPLDQRADALQVVERVRAGGQAVPYDTVRLRKDGQPVHVSIKPWPVRDASGTFVSLAAIYTDLTERNRTNAALQESRAQTGRALARLREVVSHMSDGLVVADAAGNLLEWNPAALRMLEYADAGQVCRPLSEFPATMVLTTPTGSPLTLHDWPMARVLRGERLADYELHVRRLDTDLERVISFGGVPVYGPDSSVELGVLTLHDVTERRRLEDQLRQAAKMEAIGRLAGGIAHDFNNLLTVINGYGALVQDRLPVDDPSREMVGEIVAAGERAVALTQQLLAFSRKQVLAPEVLDLNTVVAQMERLLRRLIGADIDLAACLQPGLGHIRADPGQVEQVLMNLAVNARDAMPTGGKLTIETRDVTLDEGYARAHPEARSGRYIQLAVSDTGVGMTAEVKRRVFEPFFTTKEAGRGTGLGLATVFGIVKQSGGHIEVYSEVGIGTAFKVDLLQCADAALRGGSPSIVRVLATGTETILLVEDEEGVRNLAAFILRDAGYSVLEARDGSEGASMAAGYDGHIHLLVTDVIMPGVGGRELVARLAPARPGLKVLYLSGYTDDAVFRHGLLEEHVRFLRKPFTPATLARAVRDALDSCR